MKNKFIQLRANDEEIQDLKEVAEILDIPYSQIAREAIREKVTKLKKTHPLLQKETPETLSV